MGFFSKRKPDQNDANSIQTGRNLGRQPQRSFTSFTNYSGLRTPSVQRDRSPERRRQTEPARMQSRMFSYYANRSQSELNIGREALAEKPLPRRLPTKLQRLRAHSGWLVGGALAFGLLVYNMQLASQPKVESLVAASDAPFLRDTALYRDAASKLIDGSVSNRNKLTINTTAIANELWRQFPELQSVTVTVPMFGDQPTIYVRPADPALVLATDSGTFVIDRQGRALTEARSQSQLERLGVPAVTDQSRLQFELGRQVLTRKTATFIATVSQQLRAKQVDVKAMTLSANGSELDVYPAGKPYYVKYNLHDGAEDSAALQTGSYLAVRNHLQGKRVEPAQYIDVRLIGRAYYK